MPARNDNPNKAKSETRRVTLAKIKQTLVARSNVLIPTGTAATGGVIGWMAKAFTNMGLTYTNLIAHPTYFSLILLFFFAGLFLVLVAAILVAAKVDAPEIRPGLQLIPVLCAACFGAGILSLGFLMVKGPPPDHPHETIDIVADVNESILELNSAYNSNVRLMLDDYSEPAIPLAYEQHVHLKKFPTDNPRIMLYLDNIQPLLTRIKGQEVQASLKTSCSTGGCPPLKPADLRANGGGDVN